MAPSGLTVYFLDSTSENRQVLFSRMLAQLPRREDVVQLEDSRYRVIDVVWLLQQEQDAPVEAEVVLDPIVENAPFYMYR